MAKFIETTLTLDAFKEMIESAKGVDVDSNWYWSDLSDVANEVLSCEIQGYPTLYHLKDIDGKDYVLEENEYCNNTIINEVVEIDEETEWACREYLKQTIGNWDGDAAYNLALYGVEPDFVKAKEDDIDVRVFARWNYYQNQINAPTDYYVSQYTVTGEGDSDVSHIFDTYADAQAWIDDYYLRNTHANGLYVLEHGQADAPTFIICK